MSLVSRENYDRVWRQQMHHAAALIRIAIGREFAKAGFAVTKETLLPNSGGMYSIEVHDPKKGFDMSVIIKPSNGVWISDQ